MARGEARRAEAAGLAAMEEAQAGWEAVQEAWVAAGLRACGARSRNEYEGVPLFNSFRSCIAPKNDIDMS
jgi:hypothetical protein